jgi:ATP-dependent DNA helicase PIF1
MRANGDPWVVDYLLCIDGGTEEVIGDCDVHLPDDICVPYTGDGKDLDRLIECIFPRLNENMASKDYITLRAILSTRNELVDIINMEMISSFRGDEMV